MTQPEFYVLLVAAVIVLFPITSGFGDYLEGLGYKHTANANLVEASIEDLDLDEREDSLDKFEQELLEKETQLIQQLDQLEDLQQKASDSFDMAIEMVKQMEKQVQDLKNAGPTISTSESGSGQASSGN
jgi:hypothetical protein